MKKITKLAIVAALFLAVAGCSLNSLKDAYALLTSARDAALNVKNISAWLIPTDAPTVDSMSNLSASSRTPGIQGDFLGLETLLVRLPNGGVYPVICHGEAAARCQSFQPDTPIWIDKGTIVPCQVWRNNQFYGSCIDASRIRQEAK